MSDQQKSIPEIHADDASSAIGSAVDASAPSTANQQRQRGRVHWDTSAPIRRARGHTGTTVTVRSPPTVKPSVASPSGVQRRNHPGPLNLSLGEASSQPEQPSLASVLHSNNDSTDQQNNPVQSEPLKAGVGNFAGLSLSSAKALDERALDDRAFLELQRELQRHETTTVSDLNAQDPDEAYEGEDRATELDHHPVSTRRRRNRPDTPDWSSGATTPVTDTTSESGSYDPANDSDLDHMELVPGETDGLPSRRRRTEEEDERPRGWARLRGLLSNKDALKPADDDEEAQKQNEKSYEEGGPTNTKSVAVTTSTGTRPAGPRSRATKYEREAAKLIRAHKLMTGRGAAEDSTGDVGVGPTLGMRRDHLDSGASTPDALDTAANMSAKPVTSGGVLGNLLRLYEQQQKEEREAKVRKAGFESQGTSPMSTPALGDQMGNATYSDVVRSEIGKRERNEKIAFDQTGFSSPNSANVRRRKYGSGTSPGGLGVAAIGAVGNLAGASKKAVALAANQAGLDTLEEAVEERPKSARSSAGVFGALVATTGNLIGAVSPHHAQIGPNPKRPGYTLDRYLLPEMNAKTLRRTAEIVADAAPKPFFRSQPATPGHHSPSAIARKETQDSNETQAATPPSGSQTPKKRPSSLVNTRGIIHSRKNSGGNHHLHIPGMHPFGRTHSNVNTPDALNAADRSDYFGSEVDERMAKQEWQRKLRKRAKDKRKKEEIFITMHVAAILQRQEFLLKLSRALMMFGAPTHRIETQIQQTARVLDINCRCIYLPNLMLFAFGDDTTHTSETKFIKQPGGLDLTKLTDMHSIYWNVIHDKIGVDEASQQLDELMRRKPLIGKVPMVIIGGFCSAFICVGSQGFGGSFLDALIAFPLGMFLVFSQLAITTELFSNVFEILFAAINSFAAAGLSSTGYFCYSSVVSGSIVLILPGFLVLSGALELQSKNLISGSVRLVYAIIYSLFLGFGLSIGSSIWRLFTNAADSGAVDQLCSTVHSHINSVKGQPLHPPWWGQDPNPYWAFLTVPGYATALSLRNQAKATRKEFPVMVLIGISGWAVNHFSSKSSALKSRSDVTSALGAFAVGLLSNIFGRIYDGKSYTVAAVGVLYQLPSGLSAGPEGSLLNFANTNSSSSDSFNSGFQVAAGLVEVALGLTVGLYASTVLAYLLGGRKVRGGGLFSF
ncbi:DUF1212-domain-containing protein [Meira miltonrushii]|uniref:DUF1212-domain-containing protein n=1 Tax=Meira miltonrushii TaxID=1280837 RepID=A0A316VJX7_9BASI|nr:DUF1212-domain-containing protein [Meira miltonrushii]PWN35805.1 DUF1212-domain-containing protein [Meira miltonrushii]